MGLTNLSGANLSLANLSDADLSSADLRRSYVVEANLNKANLIGAYLSGAIGLTDEQMTSAWSLEGATMPNGQRSTKSGSGARAGGGRDQRPSVTQLFVEPKDSPKQE